MSKLELPTLAPRAAAVALVVSVAVLPGSALAASPRSDPLHVWMSGDDPAALESWVGERLATAQRAVDRLLAVRGERTVANTLQAYDDAQNALSLAGNEANVMFAVGASAPLRDMAQAMNQKVSSALTDLSLNQGVYRALAAVPLPADDPPTRRYLERTLLEYRLAGVDQDDATRARIRALQDRITELSLTFNRTVQDSVLTVEATRAELEGLPEDYIARHAPDAEGRYRITTDEPDVGPVLNFAASADLRRRVYVAYNGRAYPANRQVLLDLLAARHELATVLGYGSFADLSVADQMMGSAANVHRLLDEVDAASRQAMDREFQALRAFAAERQPGLEGIPESDGFYWEEQYRRAKYSFDAQSVRPYFPYEAVERGVLGAASRIFGVQFKPVPGAKVWHPSVRTLDVVDRGRRVGRIYLDMHPREGKDKWFSSAPLVPGIRGRQLPEGMLICNFSGGLPGDPGLMEYGEVVTFFHEFGHLMHHVLGSQNRWSAQGGFSVEGDFVEAPSQMLEEFFTAYRVLARFARHYRTGAVIPADLVERMNAADAFGRGGWVQRQLFYALYSLELHDRAPDQVDLDAQLRQIRTRFSPYGFVDGYRMYASFTHLTEYASNYYTYVLDKVIALDFYSQFDRADPLSGPAAARYRRAVIDPGATKPAAELVKDFLGRPQSMDAFKAWLGEEFR
ncbi:MAG TPA: M3 family metallopeptidase [Anaeromyxobacter sp.]|nr:M3 family metallopeptidase [Anaeromyxobacter sp.]